MIDANLKVFEKSEVKVIYADFAATYEQKVNEHLKDGWVILSSSCGGTYVGELQLNSVIPLFFYQSILYKETYK